MPSDPRRRSWGGGGGIKGFGDWDLKDFQTTILVQSEKYAHGGRLQASLFSSLVPFSQLEPKKKKASFKTAVRAKMWEKVSGTSEIKLWHLVKPEASWRGTHRA